MSNVNWLWDISMEKYIKCAIVLFMLHHDAYQKTTKSSSKNYLVREAQDIPMFKSIDRHFHDKIY